MLKAILEPELSWNKRLCTSPVSHEFESVTFSQPFDRNMFLAEVAIKRGAARDFSIEVLYIVGRRSQDAAVGFVDPYIVNFHRLRGGLIRKAHQSPLLHARIRLYPYPDSLFTNELPSLSNAILFTICSTMAAS